jgi:hypothetical protein
MGNYSTEIGNENTLQELGPNVGKKQKKTETFFLPLELHFVLGMHVHPRDWLKKKWKFFSEWKREEEMRGPFHSMKRKWNNM